MGHETGDGTGKNDQKDSQGEQNQTDGSEGSIAQATSGIFALDEVILKNGDEGGRDRADDQKLKDGVR